MVADLDVSRSALLLSDEELGAAVMLLAAPEHPALAEPASVAAVESLERAGIVRDGRVNGYPARLLAIVAAPKLRVTIEKFVAEAPVVEQAWATEREGVLGDVTRDGRIELSRHEGEPPETVIHLEPVKPSLVWDRIVALMPSAEG